MAESITLTTDRAAKVDALAAELGLTREAFLQAEADERLDEALERDHDNWFVLLTRAEKKGIYDANQ